ncbi:1-pyrroline-5-carboxylate dehydrogenase [Leptospira langatensis]|uniref:1-pyrroline-5-carboxylate dehydrogenase n=1 Tax=Leptospira langatensis TaxID=2484983 RepID=A0A5F1ZV38_9LEPT|nr:proline dehydrogenase family protein [Leptospira langatensis]TGK00308.1 1-pyrroline-5-carboxylate dehydrogenase [Leptospira langatensis]TGL41056.1 1-pyrroline-5-carboxylate dehydrogenase [Leptospira langatensis]
MKATKENTSPPSSSEPFDLDAKILEQGKELFRLSDTFESGPFSSYNLFSKSLLFMENRPNLKLQSFRFADLFPSLNSLSLIARYIRLYFVETPTELPKWIVGLLSISLSNPISGSLIAFFARVGIKFVARFFILGRTFDSERGKILSRYKSGICATIDILGEAVLSEKEAERYSKEYLLLLEEISKDKELSKIREQVFTNEPVGNVSVKCSSLYSQLDPLAHDSSVQNLKEKLRPILSSAVSKNIFINLDMEQYETKEIILDTALQIFSEPEFAEYPHFGLVIQAYLRSSQADLARIIEYSKKRKYPLTIRLVKGAYWEYEMIQAAQKGWQAPVFLKKSDTDRNYEECISLLLRSYPNIRPAFASHNIRSLSCAFVHAEGSSVPKDFFEVQMLYGMGDSYKKAIRHLGIAVREYSPIGEVIPGMAYLVRRLLENSTNEGFLKNINANKKDREHLLYLENRS